MNRANNAVAWRLQEAGPRRIAGLFSDFGMYEGDAANVELGRLYGGEELSVTEGARQLRQGTANIEPNTGAARPMAGIKPTYNRGLSEVPYMHFADERFIFVGNGAGTIATASYFSARGVQEENITIIDPATRRGGLWTHEWVQSGGFNNPRALDFYKHRLWLYDRSGENMLYYLNNIACEYLFNSHRVHDTVTSVKKGRRDDAWRVRTASGETHEADYVVLATGAPRPRQIDSVRIDSNLDEVALSPQYDHAITIERHQRRLSDEELGSGRPFVIMGLGNSTAAMLRQIQDYEDRTGKSVDYTILTDWSYKAIRFPHEVIERGKSVFRKPEKGYLTGYSGDLVADERAYDRAVWEQRIVSSVRTVYLNPTGELVVGTAYGDEIRHLNAHVFALLGYERDDHLFRAAGALTRNWLGKEVKLDIRPCDGAVKTQREGYMSNLFAVGAVAAGPGNLAAATVPGIKGQAVETMLTVAARSYANAWQKGHRR